MRSTRQLNEHTDLAAIAPLLYVAWADGALQASEIERIRDAARARLDVPDEVLEGWLDPASPPSSTELLQLYRFVRERSRALDATERGGLVDLGLALAQLDGSPSDREAKALALSEIEAALGIVGREVARHFFEDRPPVRHDFEEAAPPFDVGAMTRALDGEHREDWERVRALVRDPRLALDHAPTMAAHRARVLEQLLVLAGEGIGALAFPIEHGGAGRMDRFVKHFEALAMHDLSLVVKLGVQFGLFGGAILNLGSARQHAQLLGRVGDASLLGGFAMTELGHGSNVRDLETVARFDGDRFVLHTPSASARKEWIGNAALHGQAMVVFAQLETQGERHGVHAFYVPIRDEDGAPLAGVRVQDCGPKMGLDGVDNGRLWFDHVEVPREHLLDRYASVDEDGTYHSPIASPSRRFFTMLGTLVGGRISVGAAAVTASKVALATAVRYGALRRQFGPEGEPEQALLDYPAHQRRLLPHVAAAYAHHFAAADLQRRWRDHEGEDNREIEALAAGVKALATWHGIDATQAARECCGGMGFLARNRICELRKDVDVFATFEGDNTVLLQLVAKSLLTGFAKQLSDNLLGTLLSEVGARARRALLETNPIHKRREDDEHLLDAGFHGDALRFRAHNLLVSAARRLKRRTDAGLDSFEAFTAIQAHAVALARAHVEAHVHTCFLDAIEALDGGPERDALEGLRALWAVWRIHEDVGWFLENGYFEPQKARALRKLLDRQCADVREGAVALVDAFGIPDEMLGPIAFEGYAAGG